MKRIAAIAAALMVFVTVFCVCAAAASGSVYIEDKAKVLTETYSDVILKEAKRVAEKTGFNIVIATTDDIGSPKTDAHVVEYSDDLYESLCGINTDGILLLINCDTKYDYISTSGVCINYFSDARIDKVFDMIWDDLVDERFDQAAYAFVLAVEKFYDSGKANNQQEIAGIEIDPEEMYGTIGILVICGSIIGLVIYCGFAAGFKLEKPKTRQYILENSLVFDKRNDVYIGNNVNRIYSPRSSGSSGSRGGGGHHSSTHHSSSGGRHGGGGRHR